MSEYILGPEGMTDTGTPNISEMQRRLATTSAEYIFDDFTVPDFTHGVARTEKLEEGTTDNGNGQIHKHLIIMENDELPSSLGPSYEAMVGISHEARSNLAVVTTPPWMLAKSGIMEGLMNRLLDNGINFVLLGPEGDAKSPTPIAQIVRQARQISIARTAYNFHRSLDVIIPQHAEIDSRRSIVAGPSLAAAIVFGMSTKKYAQGRKVEYADAIAPPPYDTQEAEYWGNLAKQLPGEVLTLGKYAVTQFVRDPIFRKRGFKNLSGRPNFWFHTAHQAGTIFRGDPGAVFRTMDPEVPLHLTLHGKDNGCTPEKWIRAAQRRVTKNSGNKTLLRYDAEKLHMDIPISMELALGRISIVLAESNGGDDIGNVDWERVVSAKPLTLKPRNYNFPNLPSQLTDAA